MGFVRVRIPPVHVRFLLFTLFVMAMMEVMSAEKTQVCLYVCLSGAEDRDVLTPHPYVKSLTPEHWNGTVFGSMTFKE